MADMSDLAARYLAGETVASIAADLGVNESTIHRRLRAAQFDALFVAFVDDFPEYGPAVPASHKFAEEPF